MPMQTQTQTRSPSQVNNISFIPDENRCLMDNGLYCFGQSCIVDRRSVGDWVLDDGCNRINCYQPYTDKQNQAIQMDMEILGYNSVVNHHQQSIYDRWYIDYDSDDSDEIEKELEKDYREQTDYD